MPDRTLRLLIAIVITLLIIHQVGVLISGIFGMAWGLVSAVIVATISFFSARFAKAGGKRSFWFLLPTLLFTVVPVAMAVWNAFATETDWLGRIMGIAPFLVGFALPIIFLLLVYFELRKRTFNG